MLKHAARRKLNVKTEVSHNTILVEVADNGMSAPPTADLWPRHDRMRERLRRSKERSRMFGPMAGLRSGAACRWPRRTNPDLRLLCTA